MLLSPVGKRICVIKRIHKTEVFKLFIIPHPLLKSKFHIQVGDVIRQNRNFIRVNLIFIFVFKVLLGNVINNGSDKRTSACCRVEYLHILIGKGFIKMFMQKIIRAFNHKLHNLIRRIDHAEPVCGFRVIDLIKILIQHLQKFLLFVMIRNTRRRAVDRIVIMLDIPHQIFPLTESKEDFNQFFKFSCNVVVAVKFGVVKNLVENVAGQDVLYHHFTHICCGNIRVYFNFAQFKKGLTDFNKFFVCYARFINAPPQRLDNDGYICLEFFNCVFKFKDNIAFKRDKFGNYAVQALRIPHRNTHLFRTVLKKNSGSGIFKQDIGKRVSFSEFCLYFIIYSVLFVLAFPQPDVQPEKIFDDAVGIHLFSLCTHTGNFGNHLKILLPRIVIQQVPEMISDTLFVFRFPELNRTVKVVVVLID